MQQPKSTHYPPAECMVRVLVRHPGYWDQAGLLVIPPDLLEWSELPYVEPGEHDHEDSFSACPSCLQDWYHDYVVVLIHLPTKMQVNLDELAEVVARQAGETISGLEQFVGYLNGPGSR